MSSICIGQGRLCRKGRDESENVQKMPPKSARKKPELFLASEVFLASDRCRRLHMPSSRSRSWSSWWTCSKSGMRLPRPCSKPSRCEFSHMFAGGWQW